MEDVYEEDIANEWGPSNAITKCQIRKMFKMANLGPKDILCDLGSGHGRVVRVAVKEFRVKKAIGIEHVSCRFCHARQLAKKQLTKEQLAKVDFLFNEIEDISLPEATVAYYGIGPDKDDKKNFRKLFGRNKVRIIMKDLPIVGYAPIATSHASRTTWFFLMSYPLTKYKVMKKDAWAKSFLGEKATINDVFKYYRRQLKRRQITNWIKAVRELREIVEAELKD